VSEIPRGITLRDMIKIGLVVFLGLSIIFSGGIYDFNPQNGGVFVIKTNKITGTIEWCPLKSECRPYDG
jgi:hypothetical protein